MRDTLSDLFATIGRNETGLAEVAVEGVLSSELDILCGLCSSQTLKVFRLVGMAGVPSSLLPHLLEHLELSNESIP